MLLPIIIYILIIIIKKIKKKRKKIIAPKIIVIGNKNGYKIQNTKVFIIMKGEFSIKGKYKDINIFVNSSDVILNLNNGQYNSSHLPIITIEENINNTIVYLNKTLLGNQDFNPLIRIKKNSNLILYAESTFLIGGEIFKGDDKFDLKMNGNIFNLNKSETSYIESYINVVKDIVFFCDGNEIYANRLYLEFSPTLNKSDDICFDYFESKLKKNSSDIFLNKCYIKYDEKLIVSLTSWTARINYIDNTLKILINNFVKPYKIILNLAIEEFPNKNLDLPESILTLLENDIFEINWVKKNNNVFKKLIPTLKKYKEDLIMTVDDDILYPNNMFANILKHYKKLGRNNPISYGGPTSDWKINGTIINSHYGGGSVVKYKYFYNKLDELYKETTEERVNNGTKCFDDVLYTYAALLNGYKYIRCQEYSIRWYIINSPPLSGSFSEFNSQRVFLQIADYHEIIRNYIYDKYNFTIEELLVKLNTSLYS